MIDSRCLYRVRFSGHRSQSLPMRSPLTNPPCSLVSLSCAGRRAGTRPNRKVATAPAPRGEAHATKSESQEAVSCRSRRIRLKRRSIDARIAMSRCQVSWKGWSSSSSTMDVLRAVLLAERGAAIPIDGWKETATARHLNFMFLPFLDGRCYSLSCCVRGHSSRYVWVPALFCLDGRVPLL